MPNFIDNLFDYITRYPKDSVNMCFWILTGILAVLTYRNAKKTLFNPIRSEMVKYQMKIITEFIDIHTSKGKSFENSADYSNLLKLTYDTDYLFYILTNEEQFNTHDFDENDSLIASFCSSNLAGLFEIHPVGNIVTLELVSGNFDTAKQYVQTKFVKDKEMQNSKLTLQRIYLTSTFHSFYADLLNLKSNPFIPKKIKDSVQDIINNIYRNVLILHELLSAHISKQTETRYQIIYSEFLERKIDHENDLEMLRKNISSYFKVEL